MSWGQNLLESLRLAAKSRLNHKMPIVCCMLELFVPFFLRCYWYTKNYGILKKVLMKNKRFLDHAQLQYGRCFKKHVPHCGFYIINPYPKGCFQTIGKFPTSYLYSSSREMSWNCFQKTCRDTTYMSLSFLTFKSSELILMWNILRNIGYLFRNTLCK